MEMTSPASQRDAQDIAGRVAKRGDPGRYSISKSWVTVANWLYITVTPQ